MNLLRSGAVLVDETDHDAKRQASEGGEENVGCDFHTVERGWLRCIDR